MNQNRRSRFRSLAVHRLGPAAQWLWVSVFAVVVATATAADKPPKNASVAAGKIFEDCLALTAGQILRYRFETTQPLAFNVHYHVGDNVVYPVRQAAAAEGSGTVKAHRNDVYCLMWTNRASQTAQLGYTYAID